MTAILSLSKDLNIPLMKVEKMHAIVMTSVQCRPKGYSSNIVILK